MNMRPKLPLAVAAFALLAPLAATAGTLENLERERAVTIETILNPELGPAERHAKLATFERRLVDMERMVLRDKSLAGRNTPVIRKAFENYDLTFMTHAAAEKNVGLIDNWLGQLGVTTQSLMSATIRRR